MEKTIVIEPYGHTIAYKEWQSECCTFSQRRGIIICLHGLGDNSGAYDIMAPIFADKGFCVLAIDLPGHGLSAHTGRYSPYQIAESLLRFTIRLGLFETDEDIFLVAHSFSTEATIFLAGTYPRLFKKIVLLDNPGPPEESKLTTDIFTGQPFLDYRSKLKKFYDSVARKERRHPSSYKSIEDAADYRLRNAPKFFRLDERAAYNISKRAYKRIAENLYRLCQDPMVIRDSGPSGPGQMCSRRDVEALVKNISTTCLLIQFDSWKEAWWIKAHGSILKFYPSMITVSVEGPHHAFAMNGTGQVCADIIINFLMPEDF